MSLELTDSERAGKFRRPSVTTGDLPPDLRLVHGLRRGQSAKWMRRMHEIEKNEHDYRDDDETALDPRGQTTGFQRVHRTLNKVCATGHRFVPVRQPLRVRSI